MASKWDEKDPWTNDPKVRQVAEAILSDEEIFDGYVRIDGKTNALGQKVFYTTGLDFIKHAEEEIARLKADLEYKQKALMFLYALKAAGVSEE